MALRGDAGWWAALAATLAVLIAPFFLVDVPPILDYPNHLARLVVEASPGDPVLSQMYAVNWALLPNLAVDIIGPPLLSLLPVHVAGRALLALAAILPVVGVVVYHRAVFGVLSYWPLASAIVAFNGIFFLGFINFLYGAGLALVFAGAWIALGDRRPWATLAVGVAGSVALFFCHPFAVLLFLLLVGCQEIVGWLRRPLAGPGLRRAALVVAAAFAPAILWLLSPTAGGGGLAFDFARKPVTLLTPFLTYHQPIAALTTAGVLAVFVLLWRRSMVDAGSALALAVLAIVFLVAPTAFGGGTFIDARLPVMMALVAFGAIQPTLPMRAGRWLAVGAVALLVVRVVDVGWVWLDQQRDLDDLRAAIAPVEAGSRVLVVTAAAPGCAATEPAGRCVPGLYRADLHEAALVLIERRAFWPLLFADPRQQPIRVKGPYDAIALPLGEPPDVRRLADGGHGGPDAPYLKDWAANFDYVLVIDADEGADISSIAPGQLERLAGTGFAALYRVKKAA